MKTGQKLKQKMPKSNEHELSKFFRSILNYYKQNPHQTSLKKDYLIAQRCFRLHFSGQSILELTVPALDHLPHSNDLTSDVTIYIGDAKSSGISIESFISKWTNNTKPSHTEPRIYAHHDEIQAVYNLNKRMITLFDSTRNIGILWMEKPEYFANYTSKPLQLIIQWWALKNELFMVHAGAVGYPNGGILIVGKSGSGKSSTCMECLNSELQYVGDDQALISLCPKLRVYSLFNSVRLHQKDQHRYSFLGGQTFRNDMEKDKNVIFLNGIIPQKLLYEMPLKAIVCPVVMDINTTRLVRIKESEVLRALAPNTLISILAMPGSGKKQFQKISSLVRSLPGYRLEIARDAKDIGQQIVNLLDELT